MGANGIENYGVAERGDFTEPMNDTPKRSMSEAALGNQPNAAESWEAPANPGLRNQLLEDLAESVHNAWAAQRVREAWNVGLRRPHHEKIVPALRSYKDLSDLEKEYDRQAAATAVQ